MPQDLWPAISYEELRWIPIADVVMPRSQRRAQTGTYTAAVVPTIAEISILPLSSAVSAQAEEASVEISRFDAELGHVLAPFTALLLRSESAASSQIENLTASAKAIALAELGDTSKHNSRLVVANTRAMTAAIELADRLDAMSILQMHRVLMEDANPNAAGQWRDQQVWIGGSNYGPIGAVFVPPKHERIVPLIEDLVAFMNRDDIPVFVQAAIAHAQFETIHPFVDGNGRTGRALLQSLLRAKRLTRNVTVPISAGLLTNTNHYFSALTDYRSGNVDALVSMMSDAVFLAIDNGSHLVSDLEAIRGEWAELVKTRKGATVWRLLEVLLRQPIVDSSLVKKELGVTAPSANAAIDHLVEIGVLSKVSGNYRNRKWAANDVLGALDDFARRAGRRD